MRGLLGLLFLLLPKVAVTQLIGVYSDSVATSCNLAVPFPGPSVDVYIVFTPGEGIDGILSALFRVDGLPSGWTAEEFANTAAESTTGSPFTYPGAYVSFPSCQEGVVVLYRVRLTPASPGLSQELVVRTHEYYVPGLGCPRVEPCPEQGLGTLPDAMALLNSDEVCNPRLYRACSSVDVLEPPVPTWTSVKWLYRE